MKKCLTENCTWLNKYGKCASVCIERGFAKHITNYDQLKDMNIEQVAMVMAQKILENDQTRRNEAEAEVYMMTLFDRCYRWLNTEASDEK